MVLNKRDLERAFSPKVKAKKILKTSHGIQSKPGNSSNIKVCVRVRPLSDLEKSLNQRNTIKVIDEKMLVFDPKEETENFFFHGVKQKARDIAKKSNKELQFIFDKVFSEECNNQDVFEGSTEGIISTLLQGYNCSVFVYGATGAGKTHTMLGNKEHPGITFLTMTELYRQVDELSASKDIEIGITYLEVYNENVQDLINPSGPMHLRDDSNGGIVVAGLKVEKILCADQLFHLLQKGNSNRTQHPTDANAESSRSHAVFQVYVKIQEKTTGEVKYGKLSMIDLAGSERGAATGCAGARFKEGSNINKSLLALGNCINNLADGLRHIPYRDSKLTRLLKDSLGGNCKTVMIANVSPSVTSFEDTYNTLKYATRAKSIKSQLKSNVMSVNSRVEHYVNMCNNYKKENEALNARVKALEQALKHPPVSPPRADPSYVAKLNNLYKEKKQLHVDWLNLEDQLKLLQWRIKCKTQAANLMRSHMELYGVDYKEELAKNENSLSQLEGRISGVIKKMTELLNLKKAHNENYTKFTEEMEEAKVAKLLQTEANLKESQCMVAGMEIQQTHFKKIINMQEKRLEDHQSLIDTLTKICSEYHMILRGRQLVTDSMDKEYQEGVQKMKGLKAVTWTDIEDGSDDEDGIALSSISVRPFANLSLNLHSYSLPFAPEMKDPMSVPAPVTKGTNLDSTFVFETVNPELPTGVIKESKTSFILPKMPVKSNAGSTVPMRKFTPARAKFSGGNKENNAKKISAANSKFFCPTPSRPKSALTSRQGNVENMKTPENKVSINGYKMTKSKERISQHNQHPYIIPIKLKRLGSTTPLSSAKKPKSLKL